MAQITLNSTGVASNGSLVLQSNGTTAAVTVDTAQNIGVGVTPSAWGSGFKAVENQGGALYSGSTNANLISQNFYFNGTNNIYKNNGFSSAYSQNSGVHSWLVAASGTAGNTISFTQAMTLFASGALALGTTSDPTSGHFAIGPDSGKTTGSLMWLANTGGRLYVGKESSAGNTIISGAAAYAAVIGTNNPYPLQFGTDNTIRATIDSSGNFLVGAGAWAPNTGYFQLTPKFTSGSASYYFYDNSDGFFSLPDNTQKLGNPSYRWTTVYATTGTINTSDATTKQQIRTLNDDEKAVAQSIKGLIKAYKFNDSVAEKGDGARIHVGVIAQDVQAAFVAQGLDPNKYSMFCSDTWYEVDGQARSEEGGFYTKDTPNAVEVTRLGIRYDELLAFVISTL
jgi:hypothetical protein